MVPPAAHAAIKKQLVELGRNRVGVEPGEIVEIVESVMASVDGDHESISMGLHRDIEALAKFIRSARAEIADIRVDEIHSHHIPNATDELSAVVGATEQATNEIFEAVEIIEAAIVDMEPAMAERLTVAVTQIYEACGFQDVTGQRVSKVVKTLRTVEEKVRSLLDALGDDTGGEPRAPAEPAAGPCAPAEPAAGPCAPAEVPEASAADADLMSGPQLPGNAMSQDDIDKLLADFD
ncbi:MAG: protein phosphatase CheZ [Kiloniellaceae bacterium]